MELPGQMVPTLLCVCGSLERIALRCSSGRLCPRHVCGVPSRSPGQQCCFCTTSPGESQCEELVCDRVSSCLPERLGRVAGAAWVSADLNVQSPFAQILSALWSWGRDWQDLSLGLLLHPD